MSRRKKQANYSRHIITMLNPRSPISEQFRTVRTNLQYASINNSLKKILVTSPGPSEGKTSTSTNLAVVFAQQGKNVLLIDADMRNPSLHYIFRSDNMTGLNNVLIEESSLEESICKTEVDHLDLLNCGPIPPNPAELLSSTAMEKLVEDASELYDMIIFDTPPVLAVTDAQILADYCDGALLVVRSKQTEYGAAKKARDLLMPARAKLLGVVINDSTQKKTNYYYGMK